MPPMPLGQGVFMSRSPLISDMEWNFAWGPLPKDPKLRQKSKESILETAESYGLEPVYYSVDGPMENETGLANPRNETWMILPQNSLVKRARIPGFTVSLLNSSEEDTFLSIYEEAFSSPESIHKNAPDLDSTYLSCLRASFHQGAGSGMNWIGKIHDEPVCIATLMVLGNMAGLYNVGTRLKDQGKGYGWQITQDIIENALNSQTKWIYLQTEQGSTVEKFYSRMGFVTHSLGYYLTVRK